MSDEIEEVSLAQSGKNYRIRRVDAGGTVSEIILSEANLLSLLPPIQKACAHLQESLSTPDLKAQGVEPIVPIQVRRFVVGNDLHYSAIFLTFEDQDRNAYTFSFEPADGVRVVAQRLNDRADELAKSKPPTRQ